MIKELDETYLEKLVDLSEEVFDPLEYNFFGKSSSTEAIREGMKRHLKAGKIWGYFEEGQLVGTIGLVVNRDYCLGKVQDFMVKKKSQGKGFGRKLMNFVEEHARKNEKLKELRLSTNNFDNVKLYKRLGYFKASWVMKKKL
jgi:GNAT superfamily N-acetyltransferase